MTDPTNPQPRRGRPPRITREKIAEAGRRLTLPGATMAGIAEELGVGIRALYKHTTGIEEIQVITAEEIIAGWRAPEPHGESLEDHLVEVGLSLRELALANPGLAGFLVRNSAEVSPRMQHVMDSHQQQVAAFFDLPLASSSMMVAAVAEHALAVTDVVHSHGGRTRNYERMRANSDLPALSAAARESRIRSEAEFFRYSLRALARGLISLTTG